MKNIRGNYESSAKQGSVDVVHILNDGEVVLLRKDFERIEKKFEWVNRAVVSELILELKAQTDESRKSIIAIYESGELKIHTNISHNFTKYTLLKKLIL